MVAAPGVGILSTTAPGRYERYDGTSMAAPHVSGLAALLWSVHPQATLAQVRKAIVASGVMVKGVQGGRIDASRALAALDAELGDRPAAALKLSRDRITFAVRPGRSPRAQTVSIRAERGGAVSFTAVADSPWILPGTDKGETPARISIRVDPAGLHAARQEGHVALSGEDGSKATLGVVAQAGSGPALGVRGEGCAVTGDALRVRAGSGCSLIAGDPEASVRWTLPDGTQISGGQLHGQFVRPGSYQILVASDEDAEDAVPVIIE
jgi:hypothetical protein